MDSSITTRDSSRPAGHVPCGPECRHAEWLRPPHDDWVWCNCRQVALYVSHISTECRWFDPGTGGSPRRMNPAAATGTGSSR